MLYLYSVNVKMYWTEEKETNCRTPPPLYCLPLSIPWPLPAFEAWRPSPLLPDRIPHILWKRGRSPALSPRHKICAPAASSNIFTLLTIFKHYILTKYWKYFFQTDAEVWDPKNRWFKMSSWRCISYQWGSHQLTPISMASPKLMWAQAWPLSEGKARTEFGCTDKQHAI